MGFRKYPSIENHYRDKFIQSFNFTNEQLFYAQEKLDGANFSILIDKDFNVNYYSRNQQTDKKFYNANENGLIDKITNKLLNDVQNYDGNFNYIQFYGELFGNGIQKRINYGDKKWVCFDIAIDGEFTNFHDFIIKYAKSDIYMNTIIDKGNLKYLLNIDVEILKSNYTDDYVEGIVIKPYEPIRRDDGRLLILKKKRKGFQEEPPKVEKMKQGTRAYELNKIFQQYLNDNRIKSVFSKEGEIQESKEIGKYIKLILEDMKEDFNKDYDIPDDFDSKEIKQIYNIGSKIVQKLKEYL